MKKIDRSVAPEFYIPDTLDIPSYKCTKTSDGIKLYSIHVEGQDVVRVSLVFRAGTRFQKSPFVASATLNMLSEGTAKYSAMEISEMVDFYGAYFDVNIDRDYTVVTICSLSKFLPEMIELLDQAVNHPAFSESELNTYASKRKQQLKIEREKPSSQARELFGEALFGKEHPYGVTYHEDEYDNLTIESLKSFHDEFYTAQNCFAITSGKFSDEDTEIITEFLKKIKKGVLSGFEKMPATHSTSEIIRPKKDSVQSAIRIGKLMFTRDHPDFIGMQVATTILGGYFGSRLVSNLREDKGYTYGIFSTMINLESSGYMAIATEVASEVTEDAVAEIFSEMDRMCNERVGEEELETVKNIITGEMLRILDGPFGIADVTIENLQNGTDNKYIDRFLVEVKKITAEDIQLLSKKYFRSDFVTVIV